MLKIKYISANFSNILKKKKRVTNHVNTYLTWIAHILFVTMNRIGLCDNESLPLGFAGKRLIIHRSIITQSSFSTIIIIFGKMTGFPGISGYTWKLTWEHVLKQYNFYLEKHGLCSSNSGTSCPANSHCEVGPRGNTSTCVCDTGYYSTASNTSLCTGEIRRFHYGDGFGFCSSFLSDSISLFKEWI